MTARLETMPTVEILPDGVCVLTKAGTSLLDSASTGGVELMHSCGGLGACTSCRVRILSGGDQLSPIGRAEREQLKESGILETHRLACQTMVYGNVVLERPLWRTSLDSPVTGD
jgi:ferredoxin